MSATYEDVQRTLKSVYEAKLEVHEAHKRFETAKAVFRATSASWEGGALPNEPSVDDEPTFNPQDTFNQPPKNHELDGNAKTSSFTSFNTYGITDRSSRASSETSAK